MKSVIETAFILELVEEECDIRFEGCANELADVRVVEPPDGDNLSLQFGRQREARLEDALDGNQLTPDVGRLDARLTQRGKLCRVQDVFVQ